MKAHRIELGAHRWIRFLAVATLVAACTTGGAYVELPREGRAADRGETNGTMFDMVTSTPEGDEWTIRVRGETLWAAHTGDDKVEARGAVKLARDEHARVWRLIRKVNIPRRSPGRDDPDNGSVLFRLRVPNDDGANGHEVISYTVSRATEIEAVIELGDYLRTLIKKYHRVKVSF